MRRLLGLFDSARIEGSELGRWRGVLAFDRRAVEQRLRGQETIELGLQHGRSERVRIADAEAALRLRAPRGFQK